MTEPRSTETPGASTSDRTNLYGTLGVGVLLAGGLSYVGLVDPHRPGAILPACPFHLLTGWDCPFCGGLRMTHDVLHGDFAAALSDNPFLLLGIPLLVLWMGRRWRRGRPVLTWRPAVFLLVTSIGWTVLRNLPGFPLVPTVLPG